MKYIEKLYAKVNMISKDILPQDLYTEFEIIKLLIRKGNLNLIHSKNTYQHYTSNFIESIYKIYEKRRKFNV